MRDHARARAPLAQDLLIGDALSSARHRCRRARSASACLLRPSAVARRFRCRLTACHRRTSRRHWGSWQYRCFRRRAWNFPRQPFRRQVRGPSRLRLARLRLFRLPLVEVLRFGVCCTGPMGDIGSLGAARGGFVTPPRALTHFGSFPSQTAAAQHKVLFGLKFWPISVVCLFR